MLDLGLEVHKFIPTGKRIVFIREHISQFVEKKKAEAIE